MQLTKEETERYKTQMAMSGFGSERQRLLKAARVLVVGAGGLGVPVLQYLCGMGIGTVGVVDDDVVELQNLHRQVLYGIADIGKAKAEIARIKMSNINPHVNVCAYTVRLSHENVENIFSEYDLIIDGTDNFEAKYLINDYAFYLGKPWIYGSIFEMEGHVAVFNLLQSGLRGSNYRDLFASSPPKDLLPECSVNGVLGILPGIIGCFQANEAVKIITGQGETLSGKLLVYDGAMNTYSVLTVTPDPDNPLYATDVNQSGGIKNEVSKTFRINFSEFEISPDELILTCKQRSVRFIDVREIEEFAEDNIGGFNIPLSEFYSAPPVDGGDTRVFVLACYSGPRSRIAWNLLKSHDKECFVHNPVLILKGGIKGLSTLQRQQLREYL